MKMDFFSKNSRYGTGNHRIAVELDLSYWGWGGVGVIGGGGGGMGGSPPPVSPVAPTCVGWGESHRRAIG